VKKSTANPFYYDRWLLIAALALVSFGLVMVTSASMVVSDREYGYPFHFLVHQTLYLALGVMVVAIVIRLPLAFWLKIGGYLLLACLFLLVVVLIPHVGREVNGSVRWIGFGPLTLQVSEFAKLAVVIYMAGYLVRRDNEVRTHISGFIKPMAVLAVVAFLLLLEPDFGATAVIMATALGMMFLAEMRLWQFVALLVSVASGLVVLAVSSPYRLLRLTTFMHPWAHQFNSGYQLTQALIAFGRGGIFGVGLGNSIQKLFYLPEAHTDFLFAVLGEELGLIGELAVIGLFVFLIGRMLNIGRMAQLRDRAFAAYLSYGFGLWLALQAMINIGVDSGMLPTKGLTLPFMSYGGSSMLVNCVVLGIILRVAHELKHT